MKRTPLWRRVITGALLIATLLVTSPIWLLAVIQLKLGAQ